MASLRNRYTKNLNRAVLLGNYDEQFNNFIDAIEVEYAKK